MTNKVFASNLLFVLAAVLAACSGSTSSSGNSASNQNGSTGVTPSPAPTPSPTPGPVPKDGDHLTICSKLDFENVVWPEIVSAGERDPFALALNISGSFEGDDGWENLTNNFDGQGLSLGLLNQCLGQGSLQPLMIKMRDIYIDDMKKQFSTKNLDSMLKMLATWEAALSITSDGRFDLSDYGFSRLDDPEMIESEIGFNPEEIVHAELTSKNQNSVDWAVVNLYNGSSFKSDWKSQLIAFSGSAGYRSIQVSAALKLHTSALTLFKTFGLKQYRSYLFMFDIVVQNGGISAVAIDNIKHAFQLNPNWNEIQKLGAILKERLKYVKPQYVEDVRKRKQSIIDGAGKVHGVQRDYAREFCANLGLLMP